MSEFSSFLKEKIQQRDFTLEQIVTLLERKNIDLDKSVLSRWQTGDRIPRPGYRKVLLALSEVLNLSEHEKNHLLVTAGLSPLRPEETNIDKMLQALIERHQKVYFLHEELKWDEERIGKKLGIPFWDVREDIARAEALEQVGEKRQQDEFIGEWKKQLRHPSPQYALVGRFPDDFGSPGTPHSMLGDEGPLFWWILVEKEGPAELYCYVEERELFESLRKAAIPSSELWDDFRQWKQTGGKYLELCARLYGRIEDEAKEKTGLKVISDFARTVYRYAFAYWLGCGCFWMGAPDDGMLTYYGKWDKPSVWGVKPPLPGVRLEFPYKGLPSEEELVELWLENILLATGSLKQVKKYRDIHYDITLSYKDSTEVIDLLKLDKDLNELERKMHKELNEALQKGISIGE